MKKIGFITKNKVLAQSLASLIEDNPNLSFKPFLLLNIPQAALDAEVLGIDIAVIDVLANTSQEADAILTLCQKLRQTLPACRILLLVQQDIDRGRETAIAAVKNNIADDYVFCDQSLDYLIAKLRAL